MKPFMIIPADPRYPIKKRPQITSEMKAACIGEFSVPFPVVCECEGCEPNGCEVCGGDGEYTLQVNVPWTTMKDIYKKMAMEAVKSLLASKPEDEEATC